MPPEDGPLVAADESFSHQIVETHARVVQSRPLVDREGLRDGRRARRIAAARRSGVGKYTNRNVFDGYAGVSRGREQWTVRGSRRLSDEPGPHRRRARSDYEVLEPYRRVRFACAPNDVVPVVVRVDLRGGGPAACSNARDRAAIAARVPPRRRRPALPPDRRRVRVGRGRRRAHRDDAGRVVLDARPLVGCAPGRRPPAHRPRGRRPTGRCRRSASRGARCCSSVPTAAATRSTTSTGSCASWATRRQMVEGGVEHPDGRVERFVALRARPPLRPGQPARARRHAALHDWPTARDRPITVEAIGDTGFHLGAGLYFGLDGHHHGEWRGALHVDGEHVADCTDARRPRAGSTRSATR